MPATFTAVTTTRKCLPMSADTTAYVEPVAPPMATQLFPAESQRCHWYANPTAEAPIQVPFVVDRSWPVCGATPPLIDGGATFCGAVVCQSGVASVAPE